MSHINIVPAPSLQESDELRWMRSEVRNPQSNLADLLDLDTARCQVSPGSLCTFCWGRGSGGWRVPFCGGNKSSSAEVFICTGCLSSLTDASLPIMSNDRERDLEEARQNRPPWTCAKCGYEIKPDANGFYLPDALNHSAVCYGWSDKDEGDGGAQ